MYDKLIIVIGWMNLDQSIREELYKIMESTRNQILTIESLILLYEFYFNIPEPKKNYQVKTKSRIQNKPNNIGIEFFLNLNLNKLKELNNKSAELIFEEKAEEGLIILKKLELCLESNVIEPKIDFDKKLLVIILHNIACCHQKLQEINNCISYLEAVIYHYDLSLENKHNIKINENFFLYHLKENKDNYQLLGDLILELRFSAKFHLQMSDLLSQANRHIEGLKHAKLASVICEDNIIKTNHLYSQIRDKQIKNSILFFLI